MKKILISIISWVGAFNLLMIFRYFDQGLPTKIFQTHLLGATTSGIVVGIIFSLVDSYFDQDRVRRKSFTYIVVVKSLVFIAAILLAIVATVTTVTIVGGDFTLDHLLYVLGDAFTSTIVLVYTLFTLIISVVFYYMRQIHNKIGPQGLKDLVTGGYHRPREEERIFMFLDLISATSIAEKMNAFTYSSFLQEFFYDLDKVIRRTRGVAFQFVGDEVVIVWKVSDGVENNNCIRFFFLAQKMVQEESEKYQKKYGIIPEFKAGIHYGKIVITQVGGSKQEIAFHGDTINTAARIRSETNNSDTKLLISAELLSILTHLDEGYTIETKGVFSLKGKKNVVGLIAVTPKDDDSESSSREAVVRQLERAAN